MVRKIGYIFVLMLFSISLWGNDSTFVFRVDSKDIFFIPSYKGNDSSIVLLSSALSKYFDKIASKEMAFFITGQKEAAESVQSYFNIYEGLRNESVTYVDEKEVEVVDEDYIVTIILYKTGFEPDVIKRKKRKALTMNQVEMDTKISLQKAITTVNPWTEEFIPTRRPLFHVKTNLLIDAAITPNIEFDVPVAKHWSVAAEYHYGWWLRRDNTFCWQIQFGGVEGKYWINPSATDYNSMDKWFVSLFYDLGIYDFQFKPSNGVQGKFNVMTGATAGYVYTYNDYLSFDFSAGVGFLSTIYQKYYTFEDVIVKQGSPVRMNLACPKVKISLILVIFQHVKKGGVR